jgi:predicted PurR-regulated permease PerM
MLGWVVALYVVIQALESYVVTPLVQQEAVSLLPALILMAQVLLGVTVGWLGLLLATPLTAAVVVVVRRLYLEPEREQEEGDRRREASPLLRRSPR